MEKWVALFFLSQFFAIFAWRAVNAVLIDTLRHFYKSSHRAAGAPDMSFISEYGKFNARWAAHILFLRFRSALPTTKHMGSLFWAAFALGWYMTLGLVLAVLIATGLVLPGV